MMRVETVSGMLYFGEVFFGTEFIRMIPNRALVYSKEANGYMELDNLPKEVFIPINRIEVIVEMPEEPETPAIPKEETEIPPTHEETKP